jgi:hypothetical protein
MDYEKHLALSLWLGLGVVLILTLGMMPAPTMAADATLIVGSWEGTLDPGAHRRSKLWCILQWRRTEP